MFFKRERKRGIREQRGRVALWASKLAAWYKGIHNQGTTAEGGTCVFAEEITAEMCEPGFTVGSVLPDRYTVTQADMVDIELSIDRTMFTSQSKAPNSMHRYSALQTHTIPIQVHCRNIQCAAHMMCLLCLKISWGDPETQFGNSSVSK